MFKSSYLCLPAIAVSLALPAFAGGVMNVSVQDALNNKVPIIPVSIEGGGVNVDFGPTGEKIYKITIDNPSMVTVDHCLVVGDCNGKNRPNIRLFVTNVKFDDIPKSRRTKLTVLTEDSGGESSTYEFQLTRSQKPTIYSKYVIGGVSERSSKNVAYSPGSFDAGLQTARSKRLLVDPDLKARLKRYSALTQSGMSFKKAARKTGVSIDVVRKLEAIGGRNPTPAVSRFALPVPAATPPTRSPASSFLPSPPLAEPKKPDVPSVSVANKAQNWAYATEKTDNISIANTITRGLGVASTKQDYKVLDYRYRLNSLVLSLRTKQDEDVVEDLPTLSKRVGVPIAVIKKVLGHGGFKGKI
jgi:hypothetical protein